MKRAIVILVLMMMALPVQGQTVCTVQKVYDGMVFDCTDNKVFKIWGVETPKIPPKVKVAEPMGFEARDFLESYIGNKTLMCEEKGKEQHFPLGQCYLNKEDIAKKILEQKFGRENLKQTKGFYSGTSDK